MRLSEVGTLDRDILVMKFILGSSSEEIAVYTGLIACTIENRIYEALRKWGLES